MTERLTKAQALFAVVTLLAGVAASGMGVIAGVGWMADNVTDRIDSIDRRLTHLERDLSAIRVEVERIDARLGQVVQYLAGRGPRPLPANTEATDGENQTNVARHRGSVRSAAQDDPVGDCQPDRGARGPGAVSRAR